MVVSGGKGRATAICELIKLGLINHLIIDEVLAEEIEKSGIVCERHNESKHALQNVQSMTGHRQTK